MLKRLNPEETVLYIRAYEKFDPGFSVTTSGHNGLRIGGHYPGPGHPPPPNGTGFFLFIYRTIRPELAEVERCNLAMHRYILIGPFNVLITGITGTRTVGLVLVAGGCGCFIRTNTLISSAIPNWQPVRGVWYCYEFMVRVNSLGRRNGVVAYWIDGNLAGYFPNLFMRSINSLKINDTGLRLHALWSSRVNKKWYDNVVIARSYIGPISH